MTYVELHARSAFSFLQGSSVPEDLLAGALESGMPAMALLDRDGLYGAPRFHLSAERNDLKAHIRSEEHTSELQSQSNLVCRLLLEKKKKKNYKKIQIETKKENRKKIRKIIKIQKHQRNVDYDVCTKTDRTKKLI